MRLVPATDRRVVLWRFVGGGLIALSVVLILAVIPAHRPHRHLEDLLVDEVMGQAPTWTFSRAVYPWMYVFAGAIAIAGVERVLRGGRTSRRGTSLS